MAAMMSTIIAFTRLSTDSEILAFKASGVSLYQMIPPVIMVSAAIALLTGYFSATLIPKSEIAMKQLMFQVAKEKIDKGIKEDQFTEALGDLVVYVDVIDKDTDEWQNVWVSDMRGQVYPIITMAQSGIMEAHIETMMVTITLKNGSLHRPDTFRSQVINFDEYTINIPLQPPTILDGEDVTRLVVSSLTMKELDDALEKVGYDTPEGRDILVQYHKRLVLPVGCFILSLLGMPLGLQAGPGKKAVGVPLGLALFILYYILFTFGKALAEEGGYPVAPAMWLPNVVFLFLTLYFIRQVANEHQIIPSSIKNIFILFFDKFISPILKKLKSLLPGLNTKSAVTDDQATLGLTANTKKEIIAGSDFLTEGTVHGNVNSHVFHLPGCEFYYCKNCTIEFKNTQLAEDSGFIPCRFCKTLLEKDDYTAK